MPRIKYYVTGNTAKGFVNFINSNLNGIEQIIVLKHKSNKIKTKLIKRLINHYEKNSNVEVLLSSLGKKYLDGVIIREKSLAIISDRLSNHTLKNATEFELTDYIKENSVPELENSRNQFESVIHDAYHQFAQGLNIHDELEAIYINEMDFNRADAVANQFIDSFFSKVPKKEHESIVYKRLFGTNTPEGAVNIVPELIATLDYAYFIKGRAGTGKSTFMKKVLKKCKDLGYDVELYHCSFDPESIDMVLVRELSFCIFDSTDPHEFHPNQKSHKIIDMYKKTVAPGTDEKYAEKIESVTSHYKSYMKKGATLLKESKQYLDKVEEKYELPYKRENEIIEDVLRELS